jgi:hypothetical protein
MNGKEKFYTVHEENFKKLLEFSKILQQEFPAIAARS